MKYIKKYKTYSPNDDFFNKYFSEKDYKELNIAISQIESHSNTVVIKKETDLLVNLCLQSDV